MIIRYKIIQDFKRICIAIKADKQIFILRVIIRGFVQKTVIYSRIKSLTNVRLACPMIKSGRIEIYHKIHPFNLAQKPDLDNSLKPLDKKGIL